MSFAKALGCRARIILYNLQRLCMWHCNFKSVVKIEYSAPERVQKKVREKASVTGEPPCTGHLNLQCSCAGLFMRTFCRSVCLSHTLTLSHTGYISLVIVLCSFTKQHLEILRCTKVDDFHGNWKLPQLSLISTPVQSHSGAQCDY